MFKLIALDMDGTLLNKENNISKENFKAIQDARANGVKVVIATGRPLKGVERYIKQLGLDNDDDYVIAYNGALVQNTSTGEIISQTLMKMEDLHLLYSLSKELNVNIHVLTPDSCITPKINKYSKLESDLNGIPLHEVDFDNLEPCTKIVKIMFVDDPKILLEAMDKLSNEVYNNYTVVRSAPFFLEFLDKNVNKGAGVKILAKKLNIDPENIICMEDAENDIHMIKYAGLGVAMENAFPEVKNIADYVTKTNNENGVAHVINKFINSNAS